MLKKAVQRSVRRETLNVKGFEEEHSAVLRFTFHVLPFTALESDFFSILLGFAEGGQGLVDFPDEAPFNFRDLLRAHAEDASTLRQFFEVGLDAEPGDI